MRIHEISAFVCAALLIAAGGCTASLHGSFSETSYADDETRRAAEKLGQVEGRSCQTRIIYIFPYGEPATTAEALADARAQRDRTSFLTDISIENETKWYFPYARQCIVVRATAYR